MADETTERGSRKTRVGTVVSSKMDKTAIVAVERKVAHPVYGKQMARTKKYYAQDEDNAAREGDVVKIMETRPLSKTKRWRIVEIVEKAK
ncbi:MAG TPA: 30S ribosomal protein S17 [Longimicrobiales bacterium]